MRNDIDTGAAAERHQHGLHGARAMGVRRIRIKENSVPVLGAAFEDFVLSSNHCAQS